MRLPLRNQSRRNRSRSATRFLGAPECLESKFPLDGTGWAAETSGFLDTSAEGEGEPISVRLTIFVEGQQVAIPSGLGVGSNGTRLSQLRTLNNSGSIRIEAIGSEAIATTKLADFFSMWRTSAGTPGNNANATLSSTRLLDKTTDSDKTIQMFVNGQASDAYEDYVLRDGDEIVLAYGANPVVSLNTNFGPLVLELLQQQAPITVNNFLTYVNDGDYVNAFFHRSISNFVIQTGGFRTSSTTFGQVSQFTEIPDNGTIQNEFGRSNTRGTVAMAKLGGNPNSATSEFFVNLNNNASNLDNQNGGFTVFAQVLDMSTADEIAAIPTRNIDSGLYQNLPVTAANQLAVIQSTSGFGFISGTLYQDSNSNGTADTSETRLSATRVYLDGNNNGSFDSTEISTTSDATGRYVFQTEPGVYTVRVDTSNTLTQPSGNSYVVTTQIGREITGRDFGIGGTVPLSAPASLDLLAATDNGVSGQDNVTGFNNSSSTTRLQFEVTGVRSGATVTLLADGVAIGSVVASASTVIVTTNGTSTLADGPRAFTARQTLNGEQSSLTPPLTVTINGSIGGTTTTNQVSGYVFVDTDRDGAREASDTGIPGALLTLTGTANSGETITRTTLTELDGRYFFDALPAGNYSVVQTQPVALSDGSVKSAVSGAQTQANRVYNLVVANDGVASDNNFSELQLKPEFLTIAFFFASSGSDQNFLRELMAQAESAAGNLDLAAAIRSGVTTSLPQPENRAPIAVTESYLVTEETPLTVPAATGVLQNDTDPDGNSITAQIVTQPAHGTISLAPNGGFTYTPAPNYQGPDQFTYRVSDGTLTSASATTNLTISNTNDPPVAVADVYPVTSSTVLTVTAADGVLKNDTDVDNTSLTVTLQADAAHGDLTLNNDGSFRYDPDDNFSGSDSFTYSISDGTTQSAAVTVQLNVTSTNRPPVATGETYLVTEDTPLTISSALGVLKNDSDPDANSMTAQIVASPTHGTITLAANGGFTYTPTANYSGPDQFTYRVSDGTLTSATVTTNLTVSSVNDAPVGLADTFSFTPGTILTVNATNGVLKNDTDADSTSLTVTLVANTTHGDLTLNADGSLSYAPDDNFTGTDSFTYRISDGAAQSTAVTVQLTGVVANRPPVATGESYNATEDTPLTIPANNGVLKNDSDPDANPLTTAEVVSQPAHGTITLAANGGFTYTPTANYSGPDQFTYRVTDGTLTSSTVTTSLTVAATNDLPVGTSDTFTISTSGVLQVTAANGVLKNDTDIDGNSLTVTVQTDPLHGDLTLNSNGSFNYDPDAGYVGTDSFVYVISDGTGTSQPVTVTISVTESIANQTPTAVTDSFSAREGETLVITAANGVLKNDTDPEGNPLTAILTNNPLGTIVFRPDGSFEYTPSNQSTGLDGFTYRVSDGTSQSDEVLVVIVVTLVDDPPTAAADTYQVGHDVPLVVSAFQGVLANDEDPEDDELTATLVTSVSNGSLTLNNDGSFTYLPASGFSGTDTFTYRAHDGGNPSATTTVNLIVAPAAAGEPDVARLGSFEQFDEFDGEIDGYDGEWNDMGRDRLWSDFESWLSLHA